MIFGIPVILGIFGKIPEARLLDAHTILDFQRFSISHAYLMLPAISYSRARGSGDIRTDKQTNRRTNYFSNLDR